jgi:acyl-coenzyme A thioesterase 13
MYVVSLGVVRDSTRGTDQSIVGKTLAYTSVHFINKGNEIVARGSHTKFVAMAQKDERNITSELKPDVSESKIT